MIEKIEISQIFPDFLLKDRNGYAMARAIKAGLEYFLTRCAAGVEIIGNPDRMPEWRLDEMAWETNCLYDYAADVEVKREWVRNARQSAKLHGTAEGIRQYLEIYFGDSNISEFFEFSGEPGEFNVVVSGLRTDENEAWIQKAVGKAKNVRSVLNDIVFNSASSSTMTYSFAGNCGTEILIDSVTV